MAMIYPLRTKRGPDGPLSLPPVSDWRPPGGDYAAVEYAESPTGYLWRNDGDRGEAVRVLYCRWTDHQRFIRAIMPRVAVTTAATISHNNLTPRLDPIYLVDRTLTGFDVADYTNYRLQPRHIRRLDPEEHPTYHWLHVVSADVTGMGKAIHDPATGRILFTEGPLDADGVAQVTVKYARVPYELGLNFNSPEIGSPASALLRRDTPVINELRRFVSRQFKPASDSFTIPTNQMQEFQGGAGSTIAEALAKHVHKSNLIYTWHMVPEIPITAGLIMSHVHGYERNALVGATREGQVFDEDGLAEIFGTSDRLCGDVLYLYPEIGDPYAMCDGVKVRDIRYHFVFRRPGSNWAYRPSLIGRRITYPEMRGRYKGWTLAFRKLPAADPDIGTLGLTFPHKPGNTTYPYGNLHSLFSLYIDGPPLGLVAPTSTAN